MNRSNAREPVRRSAPIAAHRRRDFGALRGRARVHPDRRSSRERRPRICSASGREGSSAPKTRGRAHSDTRCRAAAPIRRSPRAGVDRCRRQARHHPVERFGPHSGDAVTTERSRWAIRRGGGVVRELGVKVEGVGGRRGGGRARSSTTAVRLCVLASRPRYKGTAPT